MNTTTEHARRFNDCTAYEVEHKARNIAQAEGVLSPAWQELSKVDRHRRDGRTIAVTELGRVHGEKHHYIRWQEQHSAYAEVHGYLDPKPTPDDIQRTVDRLGWAAFGTGMTVGIAIGSALAQSGLLLP